MAVCVHPSGGRVLFAVHDRKGVPETGFYFVGFLYMDGVSCAALCPLAKDFKAGNEPTACCLVSVDQPDDLERHFLDGRRG